MDIIEFVIQYNGILLNFRFNYSLITLIYVMRCYLIMYSYHSHTYINIYMCVYDDQCLYSIYVVPCK